MNFTLIFNLTEICQAIFLYLILFRYIREFKEFLRKRSTQMLINQYQDTLTYLTKHTGNTIDRPTSVLHLYNLFKEQVSNLWRFRDIDRKHRLKCISITFIHIFSLQTI